MKRLFYIYSGICSSIFIIALILHIIFSNLTFSASAKIVDFYLDSSSTPYKFMYMINADSTIKAYPYISDIKLIASDNLSIKNNMVESSLLLKKIDSISYNISLLPLLKSIVILYILGLAILILRAFIKPQMVLKTKALEKRDKIFLALSFGICLSLASFHFYLGFPGVITNSDVMQAINAQLNNYAPVITAYLIKNLYFYFGKHTYYLFLFNISLFYIGLFFFIAGFYLRFRSYLALMPLALLCVGNLTLANFVAMNYIGMSNFIFCASSIILFIILGRDFIGRMLARILWLMVFVLLFFALLWRHNAIFSVFPIFFIIIYMFLNQNLHPRIFLKQYILSLFAIAVLLVGIVVFVPKFLTNEASYPSKHLWLSQIAGACVPSNDSSCFKEEWYYPKKGFSDVVAAYKSEPLNGDLYAEWRFYPIFREGVFDGLTIYWLRAIISHPYNYFLHEMRYFKEMWFQNPKYKSIYNKDLDFIIQSPMVLQDKSVAKRLEGFPENERSITLSPFREAVYTFLYDNLFTLNHIIFISIGFLILIISGLYFRSFKHSFLGNHFIDLLDFKDSTKEDSNSLESNEKIESNKVSLERGVGGLNCEVAPLPLSHNSLPHPLRRFYKGASHDSIENSTNNLDSNNSLNSNHLDSTLCVESNKINPHEVQTLKACSGEEGQDDKNMTKGEQGRTLASLSRTPFSPFEDESVEDSNLMRDSKGVEDSALDSRDSTIESNLDSKTNKISKWGGVESTNPSGLDSALLESTLPKRQKDLLMFCFSMSFSCIASAIIIAGLAIVVYPRYMSPIAYLSMISLLGFIAFIWEGRVYKRRKK